MSNVSVEAKLLRVVINSDIIVSNQTPSNTQYSFEKLECNSGQIKTSGTQKSSNYKAAVTITSQI